MIGRIILLWFRWRRRRFYAIAKYADTVSRADLAEMLWHVTQPVGISKWTYEAMPPRLRKHWVTVDEATDA